MGAVCCHWERFAFGHMAWARQAQHVFILATSCVRVRLGWSLCIWPRLWVARCGVGSVSAAAAAYPANGAIWCRACAQFMPTQLHSHAWYLRHGPDVVTAHLRYVPACRSRLETCYTSGVYARACLITRDLAMDRLSQRVGYANVVQVQRSMPLLVTAHIVYHELCVDVAGRARSCNASGNASTSDTFDYVACTRCNGCDACRGTRLSLKPAQTKPSHTMLLSGHGSGSS